MPQWGSKRRRAQEEYERMLEEGRVKAEAVYHYLNVQTRVMSAEEFIEVNRVG